MKWTEIVRVHGPPAYRTTWRILGHAEDCEDVMQDVFVEAHRLYLKGTVTHWRTFLDRLATFRALDALRKRRSSEPIESDAIEDHRASPEQLVAGDELQQRLRGIIAELPERQAAVFCLKHFEEKSNTEIAQVLDITPNAVGIALHKSRAVLRERLSVSSEGVSR